MTSTIAVFGLGYVGCASLACLASLGHRVIGVDVNPSKVGLVQQGKATVVEPDIEALMAEQHRAGRISATEDPAVAIAEADLSLICVGTPSRPDGFPDLQAVERVASEVGVCLRDKEGFHTLAIRSTVLPGTGRKVEQIVASSSGKRPEWDFAVAAHPEFLREGAGVHDCFHPPYTLIGTTNEKASATLREVYGSIEAPIVEADREVVEAIKYVSNSFHALKVVFANEVGAICKALGIDAHRVMDLFCQDHRLNISEAYLRPGFAFGGSCLPKDLRAFRALARSSNVETPVLSAIARSNQLQGERALDMVVATGKRRIGVLGLAFKSGTDDLRESPAVELLERLLGKGFELIIHDEGVSLADVVGANKQYIESRFPHLAQFVVRDLAELKRSAEVIVVTHKTAAYRALVQEVLPSKVVIDLVGVLDPKPASNNYRGIGW